MKPKTKRNDAAALMTLLKGKDPSTFTERQLSLRAYRAWKRQQHYDAFVLFDAAMRAARAADDALSERTNANRAAIALARSRVDAKEAWKRLRGVMDYYDAHPKDIEDRHMVDHALTALLEVVADRGRNAAAFRKAYRAAVKEGTRLLAKRTGAYPNYRLLLVIEAAFRAGANDIVAELIAQRRAQKPLPRDIKKRMDEIEKLIS